jgi:hypothetical protein
MINRLDCRWIIVCDDVMRLTKREKNVLAKVLARARAAKKAKARAKSKTSK